MSWKLGDALGRRADANVGGGVSRRRARRRGAAALWRAIEPLEGRQLLAAHISGSNTVYATIQAAVDAAPSGATVTVDPGLYSELVVVAKPLTVLGAQAGLDARSNLRVNAATQAKESVVNGQLFNDGTRSSAFRVIANNVTIDGFTVQDQSANGSYGAGIVIGPSQSGTRILDNIVKNNVTGLYASNNSSTNALLIQHNLFSANNTDGTNTGRAIYSDGDVSGGNLTNVVIDSNAFVKNFGGASSTTVEAAIAFQALTAGKQSNIRVTNNTFDSNGKAVLAFNATGVTVDGNEVTYCRDTTSGALRFEGGMSNVTITNNNLYDSGARAIRIDQKASSGDNTAFTIKNNNIYKNGQDSGAANSGLYVNSLQFQGHIDATNNWWGSSSGPSGDGTGTGDAVWANGNDVTWSPFATTAFNIRQRAYWGLPALPGEIIQAEEFDHGGAEVAWHDTESDNLDGRFRPYEGVDMQTTTDTGGGYNVDFVRPGEWINYAVNIPQSGAYSMDFRVASAQSVGGQFHVEVDGVNVTGTITMVNTGGTQTWQTQTKTGINLSAGNHNLRLVFDANGNGGQVGNFNWFRLNATSVQQPPAAPSGLTATAASPTQVNLAWTDNSTTESGFVIERKTGSAGTYAQVATTLANVTSYQDKTAAAGTNYVYRVRATSSAGDSGNSNEASVTTPIANVTYVSDLTWVSATNGWGPVEKDTSNGSSGAGDGHVITLNGITYTKGLGAHAVSDIVYNLGGLYSRFQSDVGADDETGATAGLVFQVFADGVKIFDSGGMAQTSTTQSIDVSMAGVQQLRLHVDDLDGDFSYDHADWAGAKLLSGTAQPPAAPASLAAAPASPTQINLSWGDVSGETGFKVERSPDGSTGWTQIGTTAANVVTFSDTTVVGKTTYFYRVRATSTAGDGAYSPTATATTPYVPAAPSNLAAAAASTAQINLTWTDNSDNESGFKVERSLNGTSGWTQIALTAANATGYNDSTGLAAGTTYYYRVRATSTLGGDSAYTAVASATTQTAATAPAAPTNLAATAASASQINLTWTDNSTNETGFKVERSLNGTTGWTAVTTTAAGVSSYSDTGLAAATKYFYRVRATNSVGDSANSNVASATTQAAATVPVAPSNLAASAASQSQINLTWTDNSTNETGFKVERSLDGATGWTQIGTTGAGVASYSDSAGLAAGTQYFYRVRATNAAGDSGYSNTASATTQAASQFVWVSDLTWASATNGWGPVEKDTSNGSTGAGDGKTITLNGATYTKGLGVHAVSDITYNVGGQYARLQSDVGADDETGATAGLVFQVFADGVKIFDSGGMAQTSTTQHIDVSVAGVQQLRLHVDDLDGDFSYDHGDWAGAKLTLVQQSPPAAPGNLVATAGGTSSIGLTWADNSTNETGFKIDRSLDGSTGWTAVTTTGANVTSYTDSAGLSAGTKYYYRVRATNGAGDSANSNVASATTAVSATVPAAPSSLVATTFSQTRIDLAWTDNSSNETGFIIERSADGSTGWTQVGTTGSNVASFSDTNGLAPLTQYFYRVRATNSVGDSANSNVADATTLATPTIPADPSNAVATAADSSKITVTWADNSTSEESFFIQRSLDGSTGWTQAGTVGANVTTFTDAGLNSSTTYFYRVAAANSVGTSGFSNVASATTDVSTALPSGWADGDIGSPAIAGSAAYSNGTYTLTGAGADIFGTSDQFHFAYQQLTGSSRTIIARVASVGNTDPWAKAGIMIRDSLAANARGAMVAVTPGQGVTFQRRTSVGGTTTATNFGGPTAPYWVKLVRSSKTFSAYRSADGVTWTLIASASITMGNNIYIGLAVTSHDASTATTAAFDHVSVT